MVSYKTPVTSTSATLADLGAGLTTGHLRTEPDGRVYMLLYSGESTADGLAVALDETETTATVIHSELGAATTEIIGFNNTGATVAADVYWWAIVHGLGYVVCDAAGDGARSLMIGAASGEVQAGALHNRSVATLLEASADSEQKAALIHVL